MFHNWQNCYFLPVDIKQKKCLYFFAKCLPKWKKTIKKMILLPGRSSSFPRDVLLADILLQLLWCSNLLWWIVGCSQGHFLPFFLFFSFFYRQTKKKTIKKWKPEKSCTSLSLIESHNGHNDVTVGHHVLTASHFQQMWPPTLQSFVWSKVFRF